MIIGLKSCSCTGISSLAILYGDMRPCLKKKSEASKQNKYLCFSVFKHTFLVQILTFHIYFSVIFKVMESVEILGYNTSVLFKRKEKHPHMGVG